MKFLNRYTLVYNQFWVDKKIAGLDIHGKMLFIYLISSPHSNMLGYYRLPLAYAATDIGWDLETTTKALDQLIEHQLISYDRAEAIILVRNYLKYNPIQNDNQAKGAIRVAQEVQSENLVPDLLECVNYYASAYYQRFVSSLGDKKETLAKPLRNPLPDRLATTVKQSNSSTGNNDLIVPNGTNVCSEPTAEISVETEGAQRKAGRGRSDYTPEFEEFWLVYPRPVEKLGAFRVWKARLKDKVNPEDLLKAAKAYGAECKRDRKEQRHIKHASTFLGPTRPYEDYLHERGVGTRGAIRRGPTDDDEEFYRDIMR